MHQPSICCGLLLLALLTSAVPHAQSNSPEIQNHPAEIQTSAAYRLSVAVDEVDLTFHASDAHGLPVNDLKLEEVKLLDNLQPPGRILRFELLKDFPIRAGILMDMSESMDKVRSADRAIAIQYAQHVLRRQTDQAFVVNFDRRPAVAQGWTSDTYALIDGIRNRSARTNGQSRPGGTALFDAIYRACLDQFSHIEHATSGNFILLFSDGDDNASTVDMRAAVDMCQRTNTSIYAFRAEPEPGMFSAGAKVLADLTAQTGGRVFRDNDSEAGIYEDLQTIEEDMRNQYRLVYQPAGLVRDGAFHRIELTAPERAQTIVVRSGYYAPTR